MPTTQANFSLLLTHVIPFALVAFRLAGVFVVAPMLASVATPMKFKALLVAGLAAAVFPMVTRDAVMPRIADIADAVPLILSETLIGFVVGAVASIPLLSLEMSGVIAGQQMGFGLARVYNPEADFDTDILGQLLYYVAMGVFVTAGGLEALVGCVADSFTNIPIGGFRPGAAPLDAFVGALSSGLELALRVSAPVSGVVLLIVILLGVIGKTMPQINIMTVGYAIKIVAGLGAIVFALQSIQAAAGDEALEITRGIVDWTKSVVVTP